MEAGKKRILLLEDDESVRKLVERALSTLYVVEAESDGFAGLRRLEQLPTPDLLVCDIMMPGLDGIAVARNARSRALTSQMPIIFLTAKAAPKDVIRGIQTGARHYMTKPFKLAELLQIVAKVLGT